MCPSGSSASDHTRPSQDVADHSGTETLSHGSHRAYCRWKDTFFVLILDIGFEMNNQSEVKMDFQDQKVQIKFDSTIILYIYIILDEQC